VIKQFEIGPMQNFCYLIGDEKTKKAAIVDPAWAPEKLLSIVEEEGFKLAAFLVSHAHYDHTNAIEALLERVDVPVYAHKEEIEYAHEGNAIVGDLGRTAQGTSDGQTLELGDTVIRFIHTPGHTPGSQCFSIGNHLITGDTLFIGGCGRSDLPGGDPVKLFESLQKLGRLPAETEICPGHDYGAVRKRSLAEERAGNPYLQMKNVQLFLKAVG